MMGVQSVWLVWEGEGYGTDYISAIFTSEALARDYAERRGLDAESVQEEPVFDRPRAINTLHVRIAEVFPDGKVKRYRRQEKWPEPGPDPIEGEDKDPFFDGHMQGHCGYHVSVSGADAGRVQEEFNRRIRLARESCTGACPRCGRTSDYKVDFWDGKPLSG